MTTAGSLPRKLTRRLAELSHIALPLSPACQSKLEWLAGFWRDEWFIRMAMTGRSLRRRRQIAAKADLAKWERYVFQRYVNAAQRRKRGEKAPRKLYLRDVAEEVNYNYGVPLPVVISRIPAIRKKAQMYLRSAAKGGKVVSK